MERRPWKPALLIYMVTMPFWVFAQNLDYDELGPFERLDIENIIPYDDQYLYIITPEGQLLESSDLENWTDVLYPGEVVLDILKLNEGVAFVRGVQNNFLYNHIDKEWTILDFTNGVDHIAAGTGNGNIYVQIDSTLWESMDEGQSFNERMIINIPEFENEPFNSQSTHYSRQIIEFGNDAIIVRHPALLGIYDLNGDQLFRKRVDSYVQKGDKIFLSRAFFGLNLEWQHTLMSSGAFESYEFGTEDVIASIVYGCYSLGPLASINDTIFYSGDLNTLFKQGIDGTDYGIEFLPEHGELFSFNNQLYFYNANGIWKRSGDSNWEEIEIEFTNIHNTVRDFVLAADGTLYALSGNKVYRSIDNGDNWTTLNTKDELYAIRSNYNSDVAIFGASKLYLTEDKGDTFEKVIHESRTMGLNQPPWWPTSSYPITRYDSPIYVDNENIFYLGQICWTGLTFSDPEEYVYVSIIDDFKISGRSTFQKIDNTLVEYKGYYSWVDDFENLNPFFPSLSGSRNELYVSNDLIHIHEFKQRTKITRDFGETFEEFGFAPYGRILKGAGPESTYVDSWSSSGHHLYLREEPSKAYEEIDLSSIYPIRKIRSNSDGDLFARSNGGKLIRINSYIQHPQTVSGYVFFDQNSDCLYDPGEELENIGHQKIILENDDYSSEQIVNDGYFQFHCPYGEYTLIFENPEYLNIESCSQDTMNVTVDANNTAIEIDYGITQIDTCSEIRTSIGFCGPLRLGRNACAKLSISNFGHLDSPNSSVTLTLDPYLEILDVSLPYQIVNDTTLSIDLGTIESYKIINIDIDLQVRTNAPLGFMHCLQAQINDSNSCAETPIVTASNYEPNTFPYDPNDMRIFNEAGQLAYSFDKEDYQYYTTRFQNTGNDTAFIVKLETFLDRQLDFSSLEIQGSSHEMEYNISDGGQMIFKFDNIMLPDSNVDLSGSNGFVSFKIKPKAGLEYGTEFSSFTDIFFDYNSPIRTNNAECILREDCGEVIYVFEDIDICDDESYGTYTQEGVYQKLLHSEGCDTLYLLNLEVKPSYYNYETVNICEGDSFMGHTETQQFTDSLQTSFGCDSINRWNLRVRWFTEADTLFKLEESICPGEEIFGYTESGVYIDTLAGSFGCRLTELTVKVLPSEHFVTDSICAGGNLDGYTDPGTYIDTVYLDGCLSRRVLDLHVLGHFIEKDTTICEGESYMGNSESGIYDIVIETSGICDSIIQLNLEVLQAISLVINQTICEGDSFMGYSEAGVYSEQFSGATGCDSIVTLNLSFYDNLINNLDVEICFGESYMGYDTTGVFQEVYSSASGCDSIVNINLNVKNENFSEIETLICNGESFMGFSEEGIHQLFLEDASGCDSLVNINIEFLPDYELEEEAEICLGEEYLGFTESGIYNLDFQTIAGCDSLISLNLTVHEPLTRYVDTVICEGNYYEEFGETGNYVLEKQSLIGCDSTIYIDLYVRPFYLSTCNRFSIFPNPTRDIINLYIYDTSFEQGQAKIYTSVGELILTVDMQSVSAQIDLSQLTPGIYLVQFPNLGFERFLKY